MDASWITTGGSVLAAAAAWAAILRNRSSDTDKHIDERIELAVGSRLTKIEASLGLLAERIPSRDVQVADSGRIDDVVRRLDKQERDLAEAFRRLRDVETTCAQRGHIGGAA